MRMSDYTPTEDHVRVAERCLELRQDVSRLEVQHVEDVAEVEQLRQQLLDAKRYWQERAVDVLAKAWVIKGEKAIEIGRAAMRSDEDPAGVVR